MALNIFIHFRSDPLRFLHSSTCNRITPSVPDFHSLFRGVENVVHRVFIALHSILWEQTEAITQPWPDLGDVRNDLLELCLETILLAFREPTCHALLELLHRGSQRVYDVSALIGEIDFDNAAVFTIMSPLNQPMLLQPRDNPCRRRGINATHLT